MADLPMNGNGNKSGGIENKLVILAHYTKKLSGLIY